MAFTRNEWKKQDTNQLETLCANFYIANVELLLGCKGVESCDDLGAEE